MMASSNLAYSRSPTYYFPDLYSIKAPSLEKETTKRCDDELDFNEIVGFMTCRYDNFWWLECVLDSFEDEQEIKQHPYKSGSVNSNWKSLRLDDNRDRKCNYKTFGSEAAVMFELSSKADPSCCPVCGLSVRVGDLDSHFIQELEKLYKITTSSRNRRNKEQVSDGSLENRWEAYLRIKSNRHCRLRLKTRKKKPDDVICPICNENVYGNMQQLNNHVEICLRKHGSFDVQDEEETVDVEGEGDYEDYEWSGQNRLPVSSFMQGGYGGVCNERNFNNSEAEEDEGVGELVVDRDENSHYGPVQYTEADLIISLTVEPNEEKDKSIIENNCSTKQNTVQVKDGNNSIKKSESPPSEENDLTKTEMGENKQVIEALKSRIRHLETNHSSDMKFICLICKDHYVKPLISVGCWHVYCEQCWLHTLGAKKLCPQCNMITSPADLRRIYL